MDEDMVTITKKEYDSLKDSQALLCALEAAGVDNWEWYHEAYVDYLKETGQYDAED